MVFDIVQNKLTFKNIKLPKPSFNTAIDLDELNKLLLNAVEKQRKEKISKKRKENKQLYNRANIEKLALKREKKIDKLKQRSRKQNKNKQLYNRANIEKLALKREKKIEKLKQRSRKCTQ